MDDYLEVIKKLLERYYSPQEGICQPMSTGYLLKMLRGVIPIAPIDEHDVFRVLTDMGFQQVLHPIYEKDDEGKNTSKVISEIFLWEIYRKKF